MKYKEIDLKSNMDRFIVSFAWVDHVDGCI